MKIAYALRFANLADFVSCLEPRLDAVSDGRSASVVHLARDEHVGSKTRVFVDAERRHNLYDDPIT